MEPDEQNFIGIDPNANLYRFMLADRFVDMVTTKQIRFCKPECWQDPFENHLLKTTFRSSTGSQAVGFGITRDYFGQSWTTKVECDGFWRNYGAADLSDGVRIQTTAAKLLDVIWDSTDRYATLRTFVGKVSYEEDEAIRDYLRSQKTVNFSGICDSSGVGVAKTLLIKRKEFEYEQEVRAIVEIPECKQTSSYFPIDPTELIDHVMFAPKMSPANKSKCEFAIRAAGISGSNVTCSSLYDSWTIELP